MAFSIRIRRDFVEHSLRSIGDVAERALFSESIARKSGVLQSLDARAKLAGALSLIVAITFAHDLRAVGVALVLAIALLLAAGTDVLGAVLRAWWIPIAIAAIAAAPALVLTKGDALAQLPFGWAITVQGAKSFALLVGRVATVTALSLLLVLTTRWSSLLRAFRILGAPTILIAIVGMTYRYVFVLLDVARGLFDGRKSRRVGRLSGPENRRLAGAAAGALLTRSMQIADDVYLAMQARGFRGEVYVLDEPRMRLRDWLALASCCLVAIAVGWFGR